jgi:hypothetical protein
MILQSIDFNVNKNLAPFRVFTQSAVPPGTLKDRLTVLQKAFLDTLKDPEFLADARKAKLDIAPIDGAATAKTLAGFYNLDPPIVAKLKKVLLSDVSGRETPQ